MENFVLNGNGQIDINRKGMDKGYKFHLQEINHNTEICSNKDTCDDTATSISSYSNYKQRIDAMFDDSRSILSDLSKNDKKRKLPKNHRQNRVEINEEITTANNIQEKIEKMFEDITINGVHSNQLRDQKISSASRQEFRVIYLGSRPLLDKNVSLMSLQDPLKQLYFEYKKHPQDQTNILTISQEGLNIKLSDKEELNPFPTIAVWASVKLSFRVKSKTTEYAFLPLITDPDGIDKNLLFRELKTEDKETVQDKIDDDNPSPIFAIVMKNINRNKQLECHGFICKTSEEAIVIAANLYEALMKKLKRKQEKKELKDIRNNDKKVAMKILQAEEDRIKPKVKVKKPAPPVPQRIPKKLEEEKCPDVNFIKEEPKMTSETEKNSKVKSEKEVTKVPQRRESMPSTGTEPVRTLRRTVSELGRNSIMLKNQNDGGDILTKVAIPRSSSFLNANGPLTRFSGRNKTNLKNEVISPLGFKELFNEFRIHEGLESMDDILNAIIDAEGMSFNDLKPIYKEFLLKLAVTLTKDELYQRSKIIMRKQKKRNKNCSFRKKAFISSIGLNKIFRKTETKIGKTKTQRPTNLEFTSIVFQSTSKQFDSKLPTVKKRKSNSLRVKRRQSSRRRLAKRPEKAKTKQVSTTSEDSDFFQPRKNMSDSGGGPNRSSSGYFSCSECSCDSEKCTCTRTDKCYCTLGHKKSYVASSSDESKFLPTLPIKKSSSPLMPETIADQELEDSLKSCSCDTDSCVDSRKCYCTQNEGKRSNNDKIFHLSNMKGICQTPHLHQKGKSRNGIYPNYIKTNCKKHGQTIFKQLKDEELGSSESLLSRAASPATAWQSNERSIKPKVRLKATSSLEFINSQSKFHRPKYQRCLCFEDHLLKEIQNTSYRRNFCEGAQHSCFHGGGIRSVRSTFFPSGSRQYSSMRCRSEFFNEGFPEPLQRSVSYRAKNFFNSVRSKHGCDSIMNHIKFPNHINSSLRFPQRMDVYNSFSENKGHYHQNDFTCHSNFKENRGQGVHELPPNDFDPYLFRKNLQRLDYNLFEISKSETPSSKVNKNKVLVVSARDPKGKVLYMGASSRSDSSPKNFKNFKNFIDKTRTNATEALAVKKSAEIAALFSDVTSKPKSNQFDYPKDSKHNNYHARTQCYKSTNLENTLGYLP